MTTITVHYVDTPRAEILEYLIARDGDVCFYCPEPFNDEPDSKWFRTIDHYHSVSWGINNGWTNEQIHGGKNLVLAHKRCNSVKSNRAWLEDGTLEPRGRHRPTKTEKKPVCETCYSGRLLFAGETCPDCNSGPQPATAPAFLQRTPKECDHDKYHCYMCFALGIIPRVRAYSDVFGVEDVG